MKKFILLTNTDTENPVSVSIDDIVCVYSNDERGTIISLNAGLYDDLCVSESVEEIHKEISEICKQ